ncbi:uncharacterized protein CC84DRAFT_1179187 [Paraphaeosphaeria sporulosa]|uniref:Uncharacterized protein n=1 Tax=Paraphaeosphaeria sporulosa TaxID=1460663 RepID=A0A177C5T6_9PLEO|nr:uncharacterized protein CC84DRAFT_1179187 [Paraphaeosphaeria sporulosa]OAG02249.1 hypothetical protein CC84DRAFT_1179187 [Paraphaeosphaeria sporulosa]
MQKSNNFTDHPALATELSDPLLHGLNKPLYSASHSVALILEQTKALMVNRTLGQLKHSPRVIPGDKSVEVDFEAIASLNIADRASFRFALFAEGSDKELARSPWSEFIEIQKEAEIPQMYIRDGFAQRKTVRKIWTKTFAENDTDGHLVTTIKGYGVMTFPKAEHTAQD